jgi:17beta-estradiol 17-dehydrogenase / very-long-chain 3-oxoacyl-CoA reductase
MSHLEKILLLIVILFIIGPIILYLYKICYKYFIPGLDLIERYGKGSWVVITGASRGQGKYLAYEFAERHFNLILIGSERTHKTASYIRKTYNVKVIVIIRDFSDSLTDEKWWTKIEKIFNKYDISVLVNNVGQRTANFPSHLQADKDIRGSLITGTYPQIRLTNLAIKHMIKRNKKKPNYKSGIIFNTAQCIHQTFLFSQYSQTGEINVPYLSVYEGANAFGYYHANSLIKEYSELHPYIDMLNIMPGAVITENTEFLKETPFSIDVNTFAKNIIKLLGNWHGATCAYWMHDISGLLIGIYPWMKDNILKKVGLNLDKNIKRN